MYFFLHSYISSRESYESARETRISFNDPCGSFKEIGGRKRELGERTGESCPSYACPRPFAATPAKSFSAEHNGRNTRCKERFAGDAVWGQPHGLPLRNARPRSRASSALKGRQKREPDQCGGSAQSGFKNRALCSGNSSRKSPHVRARLRPE